MKGILFKPDMIKAIIEGRKTQTRRVIKLPPFPDTQPRFDEWVIRKGVNIFVAHNSKINYQEYTKPRYQVGETVYIKEAWQTEKQYDNLRPCDIPLNAMLFYPLDKSVRVGEIWRYYEEGETEWRGQIRSPMFLEERFANYFIKITDLRAERLQEITLRDIEAEGIWTYEDPWKGRGLSINQCRSLYARLWDSINPKYPWASNPFVWVYTFKKVGK